MRQGRGIVSGGTLQVENTRREGTLSGTSQKNQWVAGARQGVTAGCPCPAGQ